MTRAAWKLQFETQVGWAAITDSVRVLSSIKAETYNESARKIRCAWQTQSGEIGKTSSFGTIVFIVISFF